MRKNQFFNITYLTITAAYFIMLILHACGVYPFSVLLQDYWFEIFLLFMSIIMILRAILFQSDSSAIIGTCLLTNAILFLVKNVCKIAFIKVLPFFILTFALSALIGYLFFKNKLYLKAFIIIGSLALVSANVYWFI